MKPFVRHIALFCSVLLVLCGTGSCISKRDYRDPENDGKVLFVLHVAPVNTRSDGGVDKITEKIRSLRIIAIGERGIELNEKKIFENAVSAQELSYFFSWYTDVGKKDFYIFANEESVEDIRYESSGHLPTDQPSTLSGLLDQYTADKGEDIFTEDTKAGTAETRADKAVAEDFKAVINAVYFSPNYRIENQEIFLPYSVFYGDVELTGGSKIEKTMYLVPVATKFYFRFYNYHNSDVKIQKLTIEQTDSENFLLGQVAEKEQTKPFNSHPDEPEKNETLYWVDWLAKVADETHKNLTPDNSATNDQYGWISGYSMPEMSETRVQTLIGTGPDLVGGRDRKDEETIPSGGPLEDLAGELYLGPYYFPESRYMVTYTAKDDNNNNITITEQQYKLGLTLHDTEVDSSTSNDFNEVLVIENVRSLFRDTCVLIQISMRKGDVDVYAEMASWEHEEVGGWADGGSIIP